MAFTFNFGRLAGVITARSTGGGGPPASACDGVTCTTPSGPSMILTLFDADYLDASGNITWCGQTWTPQEIRDGVSKCVCPTAYQLLTHPTPTNTTTYTFTRRERWTYNAAAPSLRLQRSFFKNNVTTPGYYYLYKDITARIKTDGAAVYVDRRHRTIQFTAGSPIFTGDITTANLGIFSPANNAHLPTKNNYRILDEQFGSITKNGVLYTHAKGNDW